MHADTLSSVRIRRAELPELDLLAAIDDDASALFAQAGIDVEFPPGHEFLRHERSRWRVCVEAGTTLLAVDEEHRALGFVMLGRLDGDAYIEQLSVRTSAMRRGIGTRLLHAAAALARAADERALLLTTYAHLPWNRPFYERSGYVVAADDACGPDVARELEVQRRWLPHPEQRLAMRKAL